MARYEDVTSADAIGEADILGHLLGSECDATDEARLIRLVAGWVLDPETGRPVCHWTAAHQ